MKPGWRTTEWWLTLAAVVVNAVLGSDMLTEMPAVGKVVCALGAVLAALGYSSHRTRLKKENGG